MPKLQDFTGQKIDKLLVLEKAKSRSGHVYWKCKCDCGAELEVSGESLRRNIPHNCGCVKKQQQAALEKQKLEKKNYLIGKRFGKLVVLERLNKTNCSGILWKCQCDCGKIKEVATASLTAGDVKSCGCLLLESHLIDITGQKFGKLTALYYIPEKSKWHCKCDCGQEKDIKSYHLRSGAIQSCGCINYSIGEQNIITILNKFNIPYIKEYTEFSLNKKRFDFAILDDTNKIIRLIEFDGIQHTDPTKGKWSLNGESLKIIQQRDEEKNQWAKRHNIPLVRIPYYERDNITLEMLLGDEYLYHEGNN